MEWATGRYERIAEQVLPAAEVVVERAAPRRDEHLIDVGCGTGNAALLAAERGARVTGVDPAQRLLDVATAEAAERGLEASFVLGEAASMPLPDSSADAVISAFGSIFAPDPKARRSVARTRSPAAVPRPRDHGPSLFAEVAHAGIGNPNHLVGVD